MKHIKLQCDSETAAVERSAPMSVWKFKGNPNWILFAWHANQPAESNYNPLYITEIVCENAREKEKKKQNWADKR